MAGDELNSDDDSDEESDDEDDDDDPDNFEDTSESDQQDSKVDSLKSKLYERARAMKQDGQPINLSSITVPSIFYVHYWLCDLTAGLIFNPRFSLYVLICSLIQYQSVEQITQELYCLWKASVQPKCPMLLERGVFASYDLSRTSIWMFVTNKRCLSLQ